MKRKQYDGLVDYTVAPHLHLIGSTKCVIDGLKGIIEYTRQTIKINLGSYAVRINGSDMCIDEFSPQGAIIEGDIISMELEGLD